MEKHLVFFDVDGTLLFKNSICESDIKALNALKAAGHEIFLNTGRSRSILPKELLKAVKFDGFICGSVYIEYHGKVCTVSALTMMTCVAFAAMQRVRA